MCRLLMKGCRLLSPLLRNSVKNITIADTSLTNLNQTFPHPHWRRSTPTWKEEIVSRWRGTSSNHFLFNGMSKNNGLLTKKFGEKGCQDYVRKQYRNERKKKVVENICKILRRFDDNLETNLKKDFEKHYKDFDFLTSKYDWLHLLLTKCHQ